MVAFIGEMRVLGQKRRNAKMNNGVAVMNSKRIGFTLVEMLIVVMIIAILAGMTLGALQIAQDSAAKARTRVTIQKLHRFVMEKYASYQYRYVPTSGTTAEQRAVQRLTRIRLLQRMEMPDCWQEVKTINEWEKEFNFSAPIAAVKYYESKIPENSENDSAELLYLLVMSMPGSDVAFSSSEIGDTDGNGLKEFLDGWGQPIHFIRWPAEYNNGNHGLISQIQTGLDSDPFDPLRLDEKGYAVFPLIYSSGPDGMKGIKMNLFSSDINEYKKDVKIRGVASICPTQGKAGCPGENEDDSFKEKDTPFIYDNITNHNLD